MHFLTLKITGNGIPFQEIETAVGRAAQFAYRAGETKDTRFGQVTYAETASLLVRRSRRMRRLTKRFAILCRPATEINNCLRNGRRSIAFGFACPSTPKACRCMFRCLRKPYGR